MSLVRFNPVIINKRARTDRLGAFYRSIGRARGPIFTTVEAMQVSSN
jgi:hypothetical protein